MDRLWKEVGRLCMDLHKDMIASVASRIGELHDFERFVERKYRIFPSSLKRYADSLEKGWSRHKEVSPREVASALKAAKTTVDMAVDSDSVDLVWTGPSYGTIPTRHTERVLCEIIDASMDKLFMVSFVAYEIDSILESLRSALSRGVKVEMLLESSREHGGKIYVDSAEMMKEALPGVRVYYWKDDSKKVPGNVHAGSVHAKCAVADEKFAFISSANLTTAAMNRNMELGVLLKGGRLPADLHNHLQMLVKTETIVPL